VPSFFSRAKQVWPRLAPLAIAGPSVTLSRFAHGAMASAATSRHDVTTVKFLLERAFN